MQVKDYLQSLSDDNKIHVEKIGSGNWYWSFTGDEKRSSEVQLDRVRAERDGLAAHVAALRQKVDDATAAREDDDKENANGVESSRRELLGRAGELERELAGLRAELAAYCDHDPAELERREGRVRVLREEAAQWTDQIVGMEGWLRRRMGGDREQLLMVQRSCYGDQFDEGEGGLCEIFV